MKTKKKETYSYKGWLISDSFIKRSFAVIGYSTTGTLFVYLIIAVLGLVLGGIVWIITSFLN